MRNWLFRPTCPCDPLAKAWVEERLRWLATEFKDSAFSGKPVVLPTREFFPDSYDASEEAVRRLVNRICGYMDVVPDRVALEFMAESGRLWLVNERGKSVPDGAAGLYEEGEKTAIISIHESELVDAMRLVRIIAHELAHARLLGEDRITGEGFDHELLTDLTVVHLGLGIFTANAPRNWPSDYSPWPGSDLLKPEYMTPPMFGWALAHVAWFREEYKPEWARYLTWEARTNLKQGLRYLRATEDSSYKPESLQVPWKPRGTDPPVDSPSRGGLS